MFKRPRQFNNSEFLRNNLTNYQFSACILHVHEWNLFYFTGSKTNSACLIQLEPFKWFIKFYRSWEYVQYLTKGRPPTIILSSLIPHNISIQESGGWYQPLAVDIAVSLRLRDLGAFSWKGTQCCRKLNSGKLHTSQSLHNIVRVMLEWTGHTSRMGEMRTWGSVSIDRRIILKRVLNNRVWGHVLDLSDSKYDPMEGCCKYYN
jgi:hypothetical protein